MAEPETLEMTMADTWTFLLRRYGSESESPAASQLAEAVSELYHEDRPGMTEDDYAEHGSASLRLGHDDGPMYVLELSRSGTARFEQWADQDYNEELHPARTLAAVTEDRALELWSRLAQGDLSFVRSAFDTSA